MVLKKMIAGVLNRLRIANDWGSGDWVFYADKGRFNVYIPLAEQRAKAAWVRFSRYLDDPAGGWFVEVKGYSFGVDSRSRTKRDAAADHQQI